MRGGKLASIRRAINYPLSTKTQGFGPGRLTVNCTHTIEAQHFANITYYKLRDILANTKEFLTYQDRYECFKLEAVAVTVIPTFPMSSVGHPLPLYIAMRYAQTSQLDQTSIKLADGTKIFYPYNNRAKTFSWIMENYQGASGYNFMAWHDTDDHNYDTHLWFYTGNDFVAYTIIINFRVIFAQPTPVYIQSSVSRYEIIDGKTVKVTETKDKDEKGIESVKEEREYVD